MSWNPTPEQRAVVESQAPRLVVAAAAGSGKTTTLAYRYARLVTEGVRPAEVLTLTFATKAAAEMKRRIVAVLRAQGLEEAAMEAETGPVQTFASFCDVLLREYALDAGLDPAYEHLSDDEASAWVRDAVRQAIEEPDGHPAVRKFLRRQALSSRKHLSERVDDVVRQVLDGLRASPDPHGAGDPQGYFAEVYASPERLREEWARLIHRHLPEDCRRDIADAGDVVGAAHAWFRGARLRTPAWLVNRPEPERQDLEATVGAVTLAVAAWRILDRRMEQNQSFDFAAIENRALALLERNADVAAAVRRRYRYAVVDEAQDVNPLQDRLLRAIQPDHQLRVGDRQQCIYAFRNADPDGFDRYGREDGCEELKLEVNFRSDAGVLEFVNRCFERLWPDYVPMCTPEDLRIPDAMDFDAPPEPARPEAGPVEAWSHPGGELDAIATGVERLVADGHELDEIAVLVGSNPRVAEVVARLDHAGFAARAIGGHSRFAARSEVRDVANCLRALTDPGDALALLTTLRSPFAELSLDAIVLLGLTAEPGRHPERLLSPVLTDGPKLDQFLRWFLPLRRDAHDLPAWEALARVLADSPYLEHVASGPRGPQRLANLRKLQAMAVARPEWGAERFALHLSGLEELAYKITEGSVATADRQVQVMTVHQAKGLEFPVTVVLASAFRDWTKPDPPFVDPRLPAVVMPGAPQYSAMAELMRDARRRRDQDERARKLYVALTRAQHRLCVVEDPAKPDGTLQKLLLRSGPGADLPRPLAHAPQL